MTPETLELLREAGHRLRSPLATIHGYASLLEAHAADPHANRAELAGWAHRIQVETDRLNGLLADLSRLRTAVAGPIRTTRFDLRALVAEAAQQAQAEADAAELAQPLTVEPGAPVPYVGDRTLLKRLAYHFAGLGIQSRQPASLRLEALPSGPRLELRLARRYSPPEHDVWLVFCAAIAQAHGGQLSHTPSGPVAQLGHLAWHADCGASD